MLKKKYLFNSFIKENKQTKIYWWWPVVPLDLLVDTLIVSISKSQVTLFSSYHKIFGKLGHEVGLIEIWTCLRIILCVHQSFTAEKVKKKKVQTLKCTQSKKVKRSSLKDNSNSYFYSKVIEPCPCTGCDQLTCCFLWFCSTEFNK